MAKGNCYEAAGKYMMDKCMFSPCDDLRLVHGECIGQGAIQGQKFGHAWVEDKNNAIDVSNNKHIVMPKEAYYAIGNIGRTVKYTYNDMKKEIKDSGHWGCWEKWMWDIGQ